MKKYLVISISLLWLAACSTDAPKDQKTQLKDRISEMEDSITKIQKDPMLAAKMPSLTKIELINRLLAYYHAYPTDAYAAECLFKVHMTYDALQAPEQATAYADTLLEKFPNYKNRALILESLASTYDIEEPRDTAMVRKYFTLLLEEPKVSAQKKKDIQARLKHLELPFDAYILTEH
ncbi:MAG: hypothetical protein RLZZ301_587 [Bacteroidota bacterium]|jgi:hypothetical protein